MRGLIFPKEPAQSGKNLRAPAHVLLVDDHAMLRAGLRMLLERIPGVLTIEEAANGEEALRKIETCAPEIVLMDIGMPRMNGFDALARVTESYPLVSVIMLSTYLNEEYVLKAVQMGAAGYVLKSAGPSELTAAIDTVMGGGKYLSAELEQRVATYVERTGGSGDPLTGLTPRHREVLQLIAEGQSTKEIAASLNISAKTVEMHRAHLMARLKIYDVAGLVRYAIRVGLVHPDN